MIFLNLFLSKKNYRKGFIIKQALTFFMLKKKIKIYKTILALLIFDL